MRWLQNPKTNWRIGELAIWRTEREISQTVQRYARGIDRQDFELVRSCFHSDATLCYDEWFDGGLDEAIAWLEASIPRLLATMHVFAPSMIELNLEETIATSETYAVNSARYPAGESGAVIQNVTGTRYLDDWARRDGVWRIFRRRSERAWVLNQPVSEDPPLPSARPVDDVLHVGEA